MGSTNFYSCLDAAAPQQSAAILVESSKNSKYSAKMQRKIALASEVSFEPTIADVGSGPWGYNDGNNTNKSQGSQSSSESNMAEDSELTQDEVFEDAYTEIPLPEPTIEDLKKAKKALKKAKQKAKKVALKNLGQDGAEVARSTKAIHGEVSGVAEDLVVSQPVVATDVTAPANTSATGILTTEQVQLGSHQELVNYGAVEDIPVLHSVNINGKFLVVYFGGVILAACMVLWLMWVTSRIVFGHYIQQ